MAAVLAIALGAVVLFVSGKVRVDVVSFLVLLALTLSGILTPEAALSGFSNPATATVAAMFVLTAALRHAGVVDGLAAALGRVAGRRPLVLYVLLLLVALVVSPFINNTAAMAALIPVVLALCSRGGTTPGRFLMPLSFATQMGGICTLVGTSTNILVSGIAASSGLRPFGMFEFTEVGLWFAAAGFVYLLAVAPLLLPRAVRTATPRPLAERYALPTYVAVIEVAAGGPVAGQRPAATPLGRPGLSILEVRRREEVLAAPDGPLEGGDRVLVRGSLSELLRLRRAPGLRIRRDLESPGGEDGLEWLGGDETGDVVLAEAVVPAGSPLEGRRLRETDFARLHRVVVLAIRHHDRLEQTKVAAVRIAVGDLLLLQGRRSDVDALRGGEEVLVLDEVTPHPPSVGRALAVSGVLAAVVAAAALGVAPILVTAMTGCAVLLLLRLLTVEQAYASIDSKVIFLLAGVVPLGRALEETGAAALLAGGLVDVAGPYGPVVALSALYLVTTILTEFMSNNAAAALLAPIAIALAAGMGADPRPFLVAVMFAASTSFMTPVGYQTNAMVLGPGGYRFSDFARVGAPLNVLFWVLATFLIPRFFPF